MRVGSSLVPIFLLAVLSGCATVPPPAGQLATPAAEVKREPAGELTAEIARADQGMEKPAESKGPTTDVVEHPRILIEVNERVQKWIDYFTGPNRDAFERFLARGSRYRAMVEKTLSEYGVPKEFYYLAMIESGYVTSAVSTAKAVGIWQFVRGTARRYGLRCDGWADERRDPVRATRAAAEYLRDLHNVFGSWRLAMAAYNAGEGRILSAIMRGKTRDFWTLAEKRVLPSETMDYVPKFLAAAIIGESPEKYGLSVRAEEENWEVAHVEVPPRVRLAALSKKTGVPLPALQASNPHLLKGVVPPGAGRYALAVPADLATRLEPVALVLKPGKPLSSDEAAEPARVHVVKRGETLSSIGRKYGLSVAKLKRMNGLKSSRVSAGRRLKLEADEPSPLIYRVKPGDTLTRISSHFGVPVRQIKKLNNLTTSSIVSGQSLRIRL